MFLCTANRQIPVGGLLSGFMGQAKMSLQGTGFELRLGVHVGCGSGHVGA